MGLAFLRKIIDHLLTAQRPVGFSITRTSGLNADETYVQNDFAAKIERDLEGCINDYYRQHGKVLNTDDAKLLCHQYAGTGKSKSYQTRMMCQYSRSAYAPAKALINEIYRREMQRNSVRRVLFLAGGPASGKSVCKEWAQEAMDNADLIMDGTFSNLELAIEQVNAALTGGRAVDIIYVHCPIPIAVNRAIERTLEMGRPVSLQVLAKSHFNAQEVFLSIGQKFRSNPLCHIAVLNNDGNQPSALVSDPESFITAQKYTDLDTASKMADSAFAEFTANYEKSKIIPDHIKAFFKSAGREV